MVSGGGGATLRARLGSPVDWAAALLALAVLAAWMHPAATRPLAPDEAGHVAAARAGTWANLNDRGPPVGLLTLPAAIALAGPERGARLMQLGWTVALAALLFLTLRDVAPARPWVRAGALIAVLLDPLTRHAVLEAHVHVAVAGAFLLPLFAWLRLSRDPLDARRLGALREAARPGLPSTPMGGRIGALVLGLALGALWATAVVGPLWTVLWSAALLAHRDARDWLGRDGGAGWLALGTLAALLVLWPGAFTRMGLAQTFGLFPAGREWSTAAALAGSLRRAPSLVVYAVVGAAALALGLLRARRDTLAAGSAATAFLVVTMPFAITDRSLLPLLPLAAVAGAALAGPGDPERTVDPAGRAARWAPALVAAAILLCWALAPGFARG